MWDRCAELCGSSCLPGLQVRVRRLTFFKVYFFPFGEGLGRRQPNEAFSCWKGNQRLWRKPFLGCNLFVALECYKLLIKELFFGFLNSHRQPLQPSFRDCAPLAPKVGHHIIYTHCNLSCTRYWCSGPYFPASLLPCVAGKRFKNLSFEWRDSDIPWNRYRPYLHKLLTINNYVNCPSNFAFARSIYLFYPPIFEKILM